LVAQISINRAKIFRINEKNKAGKEIDYIFLFSNPVCKAN